MTTRNEMRGGGHRTRGTVAAMEAHRRVELLPTKRGTSDAVEAAMAISSESAGENHGIGCSRRHQSGAVGNANEGTKQSGKRLFARLGEHTDEDTSLMLIHEIKEEQKCGGDRCRCRGNGNLYTH